MKKIQDKYDQFYSMCMFFLVDTFGLIYKLSVFWFSEFMTFSVIHLFALLKSLMAVTTLKLIILFYCTSL